ncbi:PAS domain S-box protein [Methylobacterium sp. Leaf456]|uniref:PAS domain-containing protein n=1 Tax=Methylobacterium sp. Leaf456 TaxID=1736382 RepID=UPI0007019036|nr:PAS domain-containing protein [Methylobacterium sp. Leaf456]KQT54064.1 PAS domain S-box protein [Methylobacterium sp. Leaf456]
MAGQIDLAVRRRTALREYGILDTPTEAEFDDIVKVASETCGMPVSLISLLDDDRQWFKAETGFGRSETPLSESICAYTAQQGEVFEIEDLTKDPRTADNPLVTGGPQVRFYAGVPLETADGVALGALCVLDTKPNRLTPAQAFVLRTLAHQVITNLELRKALRNRRESDRRNQAILESAVDYAIIAMDLTGLVTSWSPGAERILGWTEEEMRGRHAHVFFTEEDTKAGIPEREMGAALMHGRGTDERWHLRQDGTTFWANGEMMPLLDEDGRPEGFIKILRDRTEQCLAAERQRADAEFMRGVLASSADCIKVLDLDARLTFMSEGGMKVMEVSDFNAIKGCPWPDFWVGDGNAQAKAAVRSALAGGIGHFQGMAETFKGTPRWWDVQVTPILGPDGRPEKLLSVSRDITAQKESESRLAISEDRWRGLFTGMQEGFLSAELIRDRAGAAVDFRLLEVNPAFAGLTGLPAESAGMTMRDLIPNIAQSLIDTYARVIDTGRPETFEIHVPELLRTFEVRARRHRDQQFTALFLEISGRKQAEARREAMTELGERLRDVRDKAEIGGVAADILGRILGLSHAGYGVVDAGRETILVERGWTAPGLAPIDGPHQFRDYGSYIEDLKAGETVIIADVAGDPRTSRDAAALTAIDARALLNVPVMEQGRFVGLIYAVKATPHAWTAEEKAFVRNVADRTRAAIARVEAEDRQRTLNHELSHRMKNMLAMVQSIATQTMRNAGDMETAKNVLANRLIALSKSHDLLLGGSLDSTSMQALVENALDLHTDRIGRFAIYGAELSVGARAAMSLSLILHELATNAAKYGSLSTHDGHVSIRWEVLDDATVRLRWSESGGPEVTPPSRTGFGTRLIGRGLAGNFGGAVTLDYPVTGVVCTIVASVDGLKAEDAPAAVA